MSWDTDNSAVRPLFKSAGRIARAYLSQKFSVYRRKVGDQGDFAGFGGKTHDLQTSGVNLFSELVDSHVRRRADENLTEIHLGEMIYD
jgi:hypothetical protein